jgi:DnaJ-class molecular chaperone
MEYHPDRNRNNPNAEEMFKKINSAYDTLSDDSKKKQYDMF